MIRRRCRAVLERWCVVLSWDLRLYVYGDFAQIVSRNRNYAVITEYTEKILFSTFTVTSKIVSRNRNYERFVTESPSIVRRPSCCRSSIIHHLSLGTLGTLYMRFNESTTSWRRRTILLIIIICLAAVYNHHFHSFEQVLALLFLLLLHLLSRV